VKLDSAFFRQEAARLLAALTRAFGMENLALAEDVVQDTLASAFESWSYQGVPPHYSALLMTAAKNRALLFNEGYHGASALAVVREDLCKDAMRLARLLVDHAPSATPTTHALAALMWLLAARLPARMDQAGNLKDLFQQDRSLWDPQLLAEGMRLLELSASGAEVTAYHIEAGIAGMHATAGDASATPWGKIVELYDVLIKIRPSPVVALNRAIAIAQHQGPKKGLAAVQAIENKSRLFSYPFYAAALGELELRCGQAKVAAEHLRQAHRLARNEGERRFLEARIAECDEKSLS
jgi:predicted RNA polymerase sigma factor